jgi:NADH dehydrogenase
LASKVLLLGSTGFVGPTVARAILDAGHSLRVLVRDQAKAAAVLPSGVRAVVGDALSPESLASACAGMDVAVSLVSVRRNQPQSWLEVNVDGPRRLGEAARAAGLQSVVLVSAIGAKLDPQYRYLTSRWMGEQELQKTGIPAAVVRFSLIIGQGGVLRDFERAANFGPVMVIPGSGQTRFQPIVVDDVARCIAMAIGMPDLVGQAIDLGGPELLTYENLFELFCKVRGITKPRIKVPVIVLRPGAYMMELMMRDPVVTPDELRSLSIDNVAEGLDSVSNRFSFRPTSPTQWIEHNWQAPPPAA